MLKNGVDVVGEAHVQHTINLVQYHVTQRRQVEAATVCQVLDTTRRSHQNVHTPTQTLLWRQDTCSTRQRTTCYQYYDYTRLTASFPGQHG